MTADAKELHDWDEFSLLHDPEGAVRCLHAAADTIERLERELAEAKSAEQLAVNQMHYMRKAHIAAADERAAALAEAARLREALEQIADSLKERKFLPAYACALNAITAPKENEK